jgi:ATP/maltotriose-dependent transcriptional regulator MalT
LDNQCLTADPKILKAWMAAGFLLEAIGRAMEHALDLPGSLLPGQPAPEGKQGRLLTPLTEGETRVLRYLPSNLSSPEIAGELYLSCNTVRTHLRQIYRKLDVHTRSQAVARADALGLLIRFDRSQERYVLGLPAGRELGRLTRPGWAR